MASPVPAPKEEEVIRPFVEAVADELAQIKRETDSQLFLFLLPREILLELIRFLEFNRWANPLSRLYLSTVHKLKSDKKGDKGDKLPTIKVFEFINENTVICGCLDAQTRVWDLRSGAIVHTVDCGAWGMYKCGDEFMTAYTNGSVCEWNITGPVEGWCVKATYPPPTPAWRFYSVMRCDQLVIATADLGIAIWDHTSRKLLHQPEGHAKAVWCSARAGDLLATGCEDKRVLLWDLKDFARGIYTNINKFVTSAGVYAVAFTDDQSRLLAGTNMGEVVIWSLETCETLRTIKSTNSVSELVPMHSGLLLFSSWNVHSSVLLHDLNGAPRLKSHMNALTLAGTVRCIRRWGSVVVSVGNQGELGMWRLM